MDEVSAPLVVLRDGYAVIAAVTNPAVISLPIINPTAMTLPIINHTVLDLTVTDSHCYNVTRGGGETKERLQPPRVSP